MAVLLSIKAGHLSAPAAHKLPRLASQVHRLARRSFAICSTVLLGKRPRLASSIEEDDGPRSEKRQRLATHSEPSTNRGLEVERQHASAEEDGVHAGDMLDSRYEVMRWLGSGAYASVYLCKERHGNVAVKVSHTHVEEQHTKEVSMLRAAASVPYCVSLLDDFTFSNARGKHACMVFEVMGENAYTVLERHESRGVPLATVQRLSENILIALASLHDKQIIHADIKPENVLVSTDGESYKLADLGLSSKVGQPHEKLIQTLQYRSPETILEAGYDTSADIWSFACMIFELVTGNYLFDPRVAGETQDVASRLLQLDAGMVSRAELARLSQTQFSVASLPSFVSECCAVDTWAEHIAEELQARRHLQLIQKLLGNLPVGLVRRCSRRGVVSGTCSEEFPCTSLKQRLAEPLGSLKDTSLGTHEVDSLALFLSPMLSIEPGERCDAHTALRDQFLAASVGKPDCI